MTDKNYRLWKTVTGIVVTLIAGFTYLSTIEPSASFWDCGEFIASSYKLEVGHPPGNPVFQLIARFFTMFTDGSHAAIAVNVMSALCSALTILLLYLTIIFFAKRMAGRQENGEYSAGQTIAILGSAAVGALAYCFSDTFWFSAVEGEVYAMSSLFTALVVWAMTKWYEQADEPYANRWIILISFLMGLSIGVHLLNLLAIPVLVFLFYYRKREDGHYTFTEYIKIMLIAVAILGALVFIIIPYLPKVAAYVDLFFVNSLGLPYNSGAAFFMLALIGILFYGAFWTLKKGKVVLNAIILSLTTIVIGFSVFAVVIIRSNVMPPTNEYQPDNAFTLVRYLSREQYGSTPLLYGQYYGAPYSLKNSKYWAPIGGKYKHVDSPADPEYYSSGKMLFPRMWNGGDQSNAPAVLSENKGKNHYYLLPLLLGVMGIFFQFERDKRGCWLTFLLFFMTGIAIVLYLNQPPYQVRERDYAYAGSFYAFCIWIGLAVMALYEWIGGKLKDKYPAATAGVFTAACLFVPALMAQQNWDDHDRSNRRTAVEMARNYLNSVGEQGILVTHGDNDTFPLWYAQEVEDVRTDVRICNTSLLGTDWHIGQMKWACNKSRPLDLSVGEEQYLYGTNDAVYIYDTRNQVIPIKAVMDVFKHPDAKLMLESGKSVDYIVSRKISIPVNKENALKSGIVPAEFADLIQDEIIIEIPAKKSYITKPELFMLDLLSNYQWDRPIHLLSQGGDINIGLKDYLMYEGFSSKLVPFRNKIGNINPGIVSVDSLYDKMMNVYCWDALKRDDYDVDYQNYYTFLGVLPQRELFVTAASALLKAGDKERAIAILDKCQECLPANVWPIESIPLGFTTNDYMVVNMVKCYYEAGCPEKATALGGQLGNELLKSAAFYLDFFDYADGEFDTVCQFMSYLIEEMENGGDKVVSKKLKDNLLALLHAVSGDYEE